MDDDVKDAVEFMEGIVGVGPAFVNPMSYPVTAEQVLVNAEALNPTTPVAGSWFATNITTGFTLTTSTVRATQGTHSIYTRLNAGSVNNPLNTAGMGFTPTVPIPVSGHGVIMLDIWAHMAPGGNVQPRGVWWIWDGPNFTTSDGSPQAQGVNAVTVQWPAGELVDQWATVIIPVGAMQQIGSIGFHSNGTTGTTQSMDLWVDNIRWAAQTELDTALQANPGSTAIIPGNYVPSIPQSVPTILNSTSDVIDLRPGHRIMSRLGGVRHIREFGITVEDGSVDYTDEISTAISSLNEGDLLQFAPHGVYRVDGKILVQKHRLTIDGQGCYFVRPTEVSEPFFWFHTVHGVTVKNVNIIGSNPETTLGSSLIAERGTPTVSGQTVQLNSQYESVILDPALATPYSRDQNGNIVVEYNTFQSADPSVVANDLCVQIYDPQEPPAPTLSVAPGLGGCLQPGTYGYRYSYVDSDGRETGMSLPTFITLAAYNRVDVAITSGSSGGTQGAPYVARRVYRTIANTASNLSYSDNSYVYLGQVNDNATLNYRDNDPDGGSASQPVSGSPYLRTPSYPGNIPAGDHYYCITTISTGRREDSYGTLGSVHLSSAGQVTLGTPAAGANALPGTGVAGVAARRIYRTKAGVAGNAWRQTFLVAEIADNTTSQFVDNVADASLPLDRIGNDLPAIQRFVNLASAVVTPALNVSTKKVLTMVPYNNGGLDHNLSVRLTKMTATANTISVLSVKTYGRRPYDSSIEGGHGFSFIGNTFDSLIEHCRVEGVSGDAVATGGELNTRITVRDVISRCCHRQGFSTVAGHDVTFDRCEILEPARSGIDIEPVVDNIEGRTTIQHCYFRNVGNYGIGSHFSHQVTVNDCRMDGTSWMQTDGFLFGGATYAKFVNNVAPNFGANITGLDVLVDGLDVKSFTTFSGTEDGTYMDRPLNADRATIRNVKLHTPVLDGSAFNVTLANASVTNISFEKATRTFTGKLGGPFKTRSDTNQALLDVGPWAVQYPATYHNDIVAGDLWFPRGLDMRADGLLNVRGVSSTGVRANNVVGTSVIAAGAAGATINFPPKAYTNFGSFTLSAAADGGNMTAGTYFYRIAARPVVGGPVLPLAEKSIAIGVPNSVEINVTGWSQATIYVEGATIYRGTASGIYTVRYEVVPNLDNHFLASDTNGLHTLADLGTTVNPIAFDVNGGIGYSTAIAQTAGLWTTAAGPNAIANETGWEADTAYVITPVASWPTTIAVTAKRQGGFDLLFGAAAPGTGGTVDWVLSR